MSQPSRTAPAAAIETLIAIFEGRRVKPRPSELEAILRDARSGLAFLQRAQALPEGFLERARFYAK